MFPNTHISQQTVVLCITLKSAGGDHPPRPPGLLLSSVFLFLQPSTGAVHLCVCLPGGPSPRVAACWPDLLMHVGVEEGPYLSTPAKLPSTQRHSHPHHPSISQLSKGLHRRPVLISVPPGRLYASPISGPGGLSLK